jgi:putative chitinase
MTASHIDPRAIQRALNMHGANLLVDGKIGSRTLDAISAAVQRETVAAAHWPTDRLLIAFEQIMLRDGGLDPGPIDGVMGPKTRSALAEWASKQVGAPDASPAPARKIDRAAFFARVRQAPFRGSLTEAQVAGMNRLLDVQERYFPDLPDDHLAYCLATDYHETGAKMQPVREIGGPAYFTRMYDITGARPAKARELGNIHPGDGAKFPGMGDVQSTGRNNARKARTVIKTVLALDIDFEADPSKLLDPLYSAIIMFYGMIHGTFTGKRLADYIDGDGIEDPGEFASARRIINGTDRAALIAGYASDFLEAIRAGRAA